MAERFEPKKNFVWTYKTFWLFQITFVAICSHLGYNTGYGRHISLHGDGFRDSLSILQPPSCVGEAALFKKWHFQD